MSDVTITLRLPTVGSNAQQVGTIVVQRGELAVLGEFSFADVTDVAAALVENMTKLIDVEAAPPPKVESPKPPPKPVLVANTRVITSSGEGVITEIKTEVVEGNTVITYMVLIDGQTEAQAFDMGAITVKSGKPAPEKKSVPAPKPAKPAAAASSVEQLTLF